MVHAQVSIFLILQKVPSLKNTYSLEQIIRIFLHEHISSKLSTKINFKEFGLSIIHPGKPTLKAIVYGNMQFKGWFGTYVFIVILL